MLHHINYECDQIPKFIWKQQYKIILKTIKIYVLWNGNFKINAHQKLVTVFISI